MAKWDLYDKMFLKTGDVIEETDEIPNGLYHLSVNVWIINSDYQVLLLKKALNYDLRYPGLWTSINGNVESDEDSFYTVKKTVKEKIGIDITTNEITEIGKEIRDPYNYIYNSFVIQKNINVKDMKFKTNLITQAKWADLKELKNMIDNGEIASSLITRIEQLIFPLLKK